MALTEHELLMNMPDPQEKSESKRRNTISALQASGQYHTARRLSNMPLTIDSVSDLTDRSEKELSNLTADTSYDNG